MNLEYTLITSTVPTVLSKTYRLEGGQLEKDVSAQMTHGTATRQQIEKFGDFVPKLAALQTCQALAYGITSLDHAQLVTKARYESLPDVERAHCRSRSNEHFFWPAEAGILMLDVDAPTEGEPLSRTEILRILEAVCPSLADVPKIWYPSSSSHICCSTTGRDLTGLRGQRIYMPVRRAADIPQIAEALWTRLCAEGYGYVRVSKSGSLLHRTPIDGSVYQPSRLDFAAGAATGAGLVQRRGEPEYIA